MKKKLYDLVRKGNTLTEAGRKLGLTYERANRLFTIYMEEMRNEKRNKI